MFQYFQTTTLILLWCLVLSIGWSLVCFEITRRNSKNLPTTFHWPIVIPALALVPMLLLIVYRVFAVNLIFPVHLFASLPTLAMYAVPPAITLLLASGLLFRSWQLVRSEFRRWSQQSFSIFTDSLGIDPAGKIRRLVVVRSTLDGWLQCLPWLFGELIIVEALFNAPGLGQDAWHKARIRDLVGLSEALVWLVALYFIIGASTTLASQWIGRKLDGYV